MIGVGVPCGAEQGHGGVIGIGREQRAKEDKSRNRIADEKNVRYGPAEDVEVEQRLARAPAAGDLAEDRIAARCI
jgi:hypothetical protein